MAASPPSTRHALGLLLFLTFFAWGLRALSLAERGLTPARCDLGGFLRDAAVAVLACALALAVRRLHRGVGLAVVVLWMVTAWAEYEHVAALDAPLGVENARYLLDPTFLVGSALSPTHPLLWSLSLVGGALLAGWLLGPRSQGRALAAWLLLGLVAIGAGAIGQPPPGCLEWRVGNAFLPPSLRRVSVGDALAAEVDLSPDLSGTPRLPYPDPDSPPDVLLVVLEGVSGSFLPSVAARHGLVGSPPLHRLDAIARAARLYSSFLFQQRQTHRGEYALLCGDLPRFGSGPARFSEPDLPWPHPCLPELLARAGYRTVYQQAAPLGFMSKDQALPRTGFQEVRGEEAFSTAYLRTRWGVDDHTFFEGAIDTLRELREGPRPVFLTLLSVGTHHPFTVSGKLGVEVPVDASPEEAAFLHLDHAFGAFWQALEDEGWLADTVVVVTADEGWGIRAVSEPEAALAQAFGFAIVHLPDDPSPAEVTEPYAQSDLALSLLDLLDLADPASPVTGRSLFRRYDTGRPLFFANSYKHRLFGLLPGGRLVSCGEELDGCAGWELSPELRLEPPPRPSLPTAEELALLAGARRWSLREPDGTPRPSLRTLPLLGDPQVSIPDTGTRIVFGGQGLELEPGTVAEVEIELAVDGGEGWIHVRHDLMVGERSVYLSRLPALGPGAVVRLLYRYHQVETAARVDVRMQVDRLFPGDVRLSVRRAQVLLRPARENEPPGLQVIEETVDRPGHPPVLGRSLADLEPSDLPACTSAENGEVIGRACPGGLVLSGPRLYAPRASHLRAELELETAAPATAQLILGSEEVGLVLLRGDAVQVKGGATAVLAVEGDVEAILSEVQLGLLWTPEGETGDFRVHRLTVEVTPP